MTNDSTAHFAPLCLQSGSISCSFNIALEDPQVSSDHGMSRMRMGCSGSMAADATGEGDEAEGECRSPHTC